jgi:hypothetical protein
VTNPLGLRSLVHISQILGQAEEKADGWKKDKIVKCFSKHFRMFRLKLNISFLQAAWLVWEIEGKSCGKKSSTINHLFYLNVENFISLHFLKDILRNCCFVICLGKILCLRLSVGDVDSKTTPRIIAPSKVTTEEKPIEFRGMEFFLP